jgi:hypothetical protein
LGVGTKRLASETEPPTNRKIPTHVAVYMRVERLKGELEGELKGEPGPGLQSFESMSRSIGSAMGTFCMDTLCIALTLSFETVLETVPETICPYDECMQYGNLTLQCETHKFHDRNGPDVADLPEMVGPSEVAGGRPERPVEIQCESENPPPLSA